MDGTGRVIAGQGAAVILSALEKRYDSVGAVRAHAEKLLADLVAWEPIALDTRVGADSKAPIP